MRRDRKVVEYQRTCEKNNSKLINFEKYSKIDSTVVNKGRIHKELRYFLGVF